MGFAAKINWNRSQEWNLGAAKLGPKTAKFGPKVVFLVIFGQILVFTAHLAPCPTKKEEHWLVSLWWSTKILPSDCHNCDYWPTDARFCLKIAIFGLSGLFWPWWLICCHVCHKNKQEYSALVFYYYWSIELLLISRRNFIYWPKMTIYAHYYYRQCRFDGHVAHDGWGSAQQGGSW